ncbi:hypothetical protein CALCODRAFT_506480 [Calocera cornea HHB12733]|uniref:Uncharacterized protein n=1 Tax=Calocera cornea HHB12733 TaxID=1353952 RepID=A0A165IWA3_9BASI|nr:hypothetical protein CALCODRAFT_506480 [Calocera cornea HHB12733]
MPHQAGIGNYPSPPADIHELGRRDNQGPFEVENGPLCAAHRDALWMESMNCMHAQEHLMEILHAHLGGSFFLIGSPGAGIPRTWSASYSQDIQNNSNMTEQAEHMCVIFDTIIRSLNAPEQPTTTKLHDKTDRSPFSDINLALGPLKLTSDQLVHIHGALERFESSEGCSEVLMKELQSDDTMTEEQTEVASAVLRLVRGVRGQT